MSNQLTPEQIAEYELLKKAKAKTVERYKNYAARRSAIQRLMIQKALNAKITITESEVDHEMNIPSHLKPKLDLTMCVVDK